MTNTLNVTVVQISNDGAKLPEEMARLGEHIRAHKSDFVLLPEMPFFEWLAADQTPDAQRWQQAIEAHSVWIDRLSELGTTAIVSTRPHLTAAGSRRNQAYLWQAHKGAMGFHEKRYLPNEEGYWEATWYDMGEKSFDSARFGEVRIGAQICTEMWYFEHARHYGQQAVDLLCVPRATPHASVDKWLAGGRAGAVVSGSYHLSSNLYAPKGAKADIGGLSWIISPEGDVLATTDPDNPFATVCVDLDFAKASKTTYPRYVHE